MKKLVSFVFAAVVSMGTLSANLVNDGEFHFKSFLELMNFGAKGQTLEAYRDYARNQNLNLIFQKEEPMEVYFVWAQNVTYKKGHMTETYTRTGEAPRLLNVDLTPNGGDKFVPITITLIFPDKAAQRRFYNEGMKIGCIVNDKLEATDIDPTWSNVSGIKYCIDAKRLTSWRFMYFYEKDGMYMCTFLF